MNILTFDTTFDKSYITLSCDGEIEESLIISSDDEKYHSAYLLSSIAKILKNHQLSMSQINKIATNIGPGSFTGIRVCLTVAKIISQQLKIDVYGFTSTEILAKLNSQKNRTLVALDARRGKFYIQMFDENQKEILPLNAYECDKLAEIAKEQTPYIICDKSVQKYLNERNIGCFCFEESNSDLGKCLAELAIKKAKDNIDSPWYKLEPLYIQPPPISCKK